MVKVSVIIPVYNVEEYLKECLDSVVNQTLEDIEIICVNDGSTDNSLNILESYADSDERIKILSKENSGQGSARNLGFKNCLGEYVYFMDADDYIDLNTLEDFYNNAVSNGSEVVISKIARLNEKSNEIDYSKPGFDFEEIFGNQNFNNFLFNYHDVKKYVLNSSFAPWTKFYKRDFLLNHNILFVENTYFEDVPFHIEVMLNAEKMSFLPEFNYYYRFNPSSSVNTGKNGYDVFYIVNFVEEYLINEDYYEEFKNEFDLFKISQILTYLPITKTEKYFQKAKSELSKIELSSNHLVSGNSLIQYEIILNAENYHGFEITEYYKSKYESIKIDIDELKLLNKEKYDNLNKKYNSLNKKYNSLNKKYNSLNKKYASLNNNRNKLKKEVKRLNKKNKELNCTLDEIYSSNSWKMTSILRNLRRKL